MRTTTTMLIFCLALLTTNAMAQTPTTGSIVGMIAAENDAGVPGVSVTAISSTLIRPKSVKTGYDGRFHISHLPPGRYAVSVNPAIGPLFEPVEVTVYLSKTSTISIRWRQPVRSKPGKEVARNEGSKPTSSRGSFPIPSATQLSETHSLSSAVEVAPKSTPTTSSSGVPAKQDLGVNAGKPAEGRSATALTSTYRVGVGDVLDIQVSKRPARESTFFTVTAGGRLEHPVLNQPISVSGLTTEEISEQLKNELRRLAISEHSEVLVAVREYSSHRILVSGLVKEPGTKILRREAIPLYVVLADAQPSPEAGQAIVIDHTGKIATVDLSDPGGAEFLVRPGNVITVQANPKQFFYIGGGVEIPGEKSFRPGLTLTQAVLTAGGIKGKSKKVELGRAGTNRLLELTRYNLADINSGKIPDPLVQPGDRITILR